MCGKFEEKMKMAINILIKYVICEIMLAVSFVKWVFKVTINSVSSLTLLKSAELKILIINVAFKSYILTMLTIC